MLSRRSSVSALTGMTSILANYVAGPQTALPGAPSVGKRKPKGKRRLAPSGLAPSS